MTNLYQSLLVDRNITITADLKSYSKIFDSSYEERLVKFKNLLYKLIRVMQQDELIKILLNFMKNLILILRSLLSLILNLERVSK